MSGHSKWAQIKHQKGVADQKRGQLFSKLLAAISAAARIDPNPEANPRLRSLIEKAKANNVPFINIERALKRATEVSESLEEIVCEAYGPGGAAILIQGVTENKNRTIAEIRKILTDHEAKWAEPGSVRWAFEENSHDGSWRAKFSQPLSREERARVSILIEDLENHNDVQKVYVNAEEKRVGL